MRSPNTIWADGFASRQNLKVTSEGWGPFETFRRVPVSNRYMISIALALCLGPSTRLHRVYANKKEVWSGFMEGGDEVDINEPFLFGGPEEGGGFWGKMRFYAGDAAQTQDSRIAHFFPETPAYNGICYVVFDDVTFGTSAHLPALAFEASRYTDNLGMGDVVSRIGDDINPAEALYTILITKWGGLNVDALSIDIDSFKDAATVLKSENNGLSLLLTNVRSGRNVVEEILRQIDGLLYQNPSNMLLKLRLIRETLDIGGAPRFNETNVLSIEEYIRSSWSDTFNVSRVVYSNRHAKYESGVAIAQDMANIASQDRFKARKVSFPNCMEPSLANELAARELAQTSVPVVKLSLVVNRSVAHGLTPGDLVVFSWKKFGVDNLILRVERLDFGSLTEGQIKLSCVQDYFAVGTASFSPPAPSLAASFVSKATAPDATALIESPYYFVAPITGENLSAPAVLARSLNDFELGYNARFEQSGLVRTLTNANFCLSGVLHDAIAETDGFDGTPISFVINDVSNQELYQSATKEENRKGANILLLGNEFMTFESWTDDAGGGKLLHNVRRALLDTTFEAHVAGAPVWLRVENSAVVASASGFSGNETVVAEISTFTRSNYLTPPEIATLTPDKRLDRPIAPALVTLNGKRTGATSAASSVVAWRPRAADRLSFQDDPSESVPTGVTYQVDVYAGTTHQTSMTLSGLTGTSTPLTFPAGFPAGPGRIEVTAERQLASSTISSRSKSIVYFTHS